MSLSSPEDLVYSYSVSASGSGEKGKGSTSGRFKWPCVWHFIMGSLCYSVTYTGYNAFGMDERPGMVHYLITILLVGLPIFYTQVFFGQYCQMGMLNLRYIMPMARGLIYTFLMCVVMKTVRFGYALTDIMLYFLMSFQNTLPWTVCPKNYDYVCNGTDLSSGYPHTAYVFWRYIYTRNPTLAIKDVKFSVPSVFAMVGLCLQWVLMFIIATVSYNGHRKITRILFYIHFSILCTLLITVFIWVGKDVTLYHLLSSQTESLFKTRSWLLAVRCVVVDLCLTDLYNMYSGAHLAPTAPSATLSTGCVFGITLSNTLASCLSCICHIILNTRHPVKFSAKVPHDLGSGTGNILIVIPQGLSYITLPQWWCFLFFTSVLCTLVSNQVLHLVNILMTITDMYPNFIKYKTYLLAGCCLLGCGVGTILYSNTIYAACKYTVESALDNLMVVSTFIWAITVYWVYGVGRLCDDVQFTIGTQPTKFWKITWYIIPAILAVLIVVYVMLYFSMHFIYIIINVCLLVVLIASYVFFFVIELFTNIKNKNLLGTFQSHKRWGPPDPEERLYRKYFNPRRETKNQAHKMICRHNCLLTSLVLKNIVEQEDALRSEYLTKLAEISQTGRDSVGSYDIHTILDSIIL